MHEYEGDAAIRRRYQQGLLALGAACATAALACAVAQAVGGPTWLDLLAGVLAIVALPLAGKSLPHAHPAD